MTPAERGRLGTEDHVIPRSMGGVDNEENMVLSCERDNNLKATIPYPVFKTFADLVLREYPDLPTPLLRNSLNRYVMHLLERVTDNRKAMRDASTIALLKLKDEIDTFEGKGRKRKC